MVWRQACPLMLAVWATCLHGQAGGEDAGVDRLIRRAFELNREILAARQRVAEARGLLRQAGVRPAPVVEANTGTGRPLGTAGEEEYAIGYFHPIETGGKRPKRILVAERALEAAEADLSERGRQLAYRIRTRHIEAAASARKAEAIAGIAKVNRESYRLVDARVRRDDAAPLERQLLLVELNRTEAQRAAAVGQARAARLELLRAAGAGADAAFPAPALPDEPPAIEGSLDELRRGALERRPDLRAARALASQAAAELELAEAQGLADLTLSAQYTRRHAQFEDPSRTTVSGQAAPLKDRDNVLTLGISIPIQSRKRNLGNVEAAGARRRAARLTAEHLGIMIPLEVETAWQRYQAAIQAASILNQGVLDESEKNLVVIRKAYELGQLRLLDVLNEQRRLLEIELSFVDARAEVARSRAELEYAVGGDPL